jgi:hypothetical protein
MLTTCEKLETVLIEPSDHRKIVQLYVNRLCHNIELLDIFCTQLYVALIVS